MNTSCKATFKNGSVQEFSSIEEASNKTGLSVASIKIRCNKKGCKGKDGTAFEWLDEHTKRSYQAKKSKSKGSSWEYQVRDDLKAAGYDVVTARGESKVKDNGKQDIISIDDSLPFSCQCKATQVLPNYFKMRDECIDQEKPFCVMWKKQTNDGSNSPGNLAIIPYEYFLELISNKI